jgi:hypothetical protein
VVVGFKRWMGVIMSSVLLVRLDVGKSGVGCVGPSIMRLGGLGILLINLIARIGLDERLLFFLLISFIFAFIWLAFNGNHVCRVVTYSF